MNGREMSNSIFVNLPDSLGNTSTDCGLIKKYGRTNLLSSSVSMDGDCTVFCWRK